MAMMKEEIQTILDNESGEFFESFCEVLMNEINSDDERYDKKGRQLLLAALQSDDPDGLFMSLCGWTLSTLIGKAKLNDE
jgi:hypothetical protein